MEFMAMTLVPIVTARGKTATATDIERTAFMWKALHNWSNAELVGLGTTDWIHLQYCLFA
jgi:hypothetical protein